MDTYINNHDCKDELKEVELKATPTRLAIMQLLENSSKPIDVSSIIDYLTSHKIKADPVTVFRIINTFTDKGITKKIKLNEGKFRYELSSKTEHHHLVCERCGEIEDISDCNINALEQDIENKKGFRVTSHSLEFYGICSCCKECQD